MSLSRSFELANDFSKNKIFLKNSSELNQTISPSATFLLYPTNIGALGFIKAMEGE